MIAVIVVVVVVLKEVATEDIRPVCSRVAVTSGGREVARGLPTGSAEVLQCSK